MYICVCFIQNQYNMPSSTQGSLTLSNIQQYPLQMNKIMVVYEKKI